MGAQSRVGAGVPAGGQFAASARGEAAVGLLDREPATAPEPAPDPVLGEPALVTFDEVAHVGTLDATDRQDWSYEGEGLSVSVNPDDWSAIARLGDAPTWTLTRTDGEPLRFVSWHDLDPRARTAVRAWGTEQGWIAEKTVYRVTYLGMDDNGYDTICSFEATTAEDAEEEAALCDVDPDHPDTDFLVTTAWRPTADFPDRRIGRDDDPTDVLLAHYVREQRPDLDGVWWADAYAPESLSCPRGVLVHDLDGYRRRSA